MDIPAFHPSWLVTFWLTTPGLNKLDPHLLSALILVVILCVYFYKRKKRSSIQVDADEEKFQHLLMKKNMIEKELTELDGKWEKDSTESLLQKKRELEKQLDLTKQKLVEFTK